MPKVIGCLLGEQTGRHVDVSNSFEMRLQGTPDSPDFASDVYSAKLAQYAECYKDLHVLGWYCIGDVLGDMEMTLHKKFVEHSDVQAPILLMMNPARVMAPSAKELPLDMYESGAPNYCPPASGRQNIAFVLLCCVAKGHGSFECLLHTPLKSFRHRLCV